jgi:hypothetical protein
MDGFSLTPASAGPASAANDNGDEAAEEKGALESAGDAVVGTGELVGGVAVGAVETAWDGVVGVAGLAWEGVNMVNDAAGTVLDAAVGWTGIDGFEGHAERNQARGQAMFDGVMSLPELPGKIATAAEQGWDRFEHNWETGNYYDAGRQIGSVGLEAATIAVPVAKAGALSRMGRVDDLTGLQRYNVLDGQGHAVSRHGAHVTGQMLEDRAVRGIDPITGTRLDGVRSTPGNPVNHTAPRTATSITGVDAFVGTERNIRASQQYRDFRDAALVDGRSRFSVELPLEDVLGPDYAAHVQGVTRIGSAKNPQGAATDLTGGKMRAVFEFNPGGEPSLVTMHPVTK